MARKAVKRNVVPVPRDFDEVAWFIGQIGAEQRELDKIKLKFNTHIERTKEKAVGEAKPHEERIRELFEGLFAFAETNREKLTDGGKHKTVHLPTGTFGWRMTPPKVNLRGVQKVIKRLKDLGLSRFIRVKEEVDKQAMLKEPDVAKGITGVTISQREEFVVSPSELEVGVTESTEKLREKASS